MGVTENNSGIDTMIAAGTIAAQSFVGYDGKVCGASAKAAGITVFDVVTGDIISLATGGRRIVTAGAAVSVGAAIASDATGLAVTAANVAATVASGATTVTSTAANGAIVAVAGGVLPVAVNGYARTASSASGDLIEIDFR